MTEVEVPAAPPRVVRIWSPLAVGVYTLFLGYPAGILLAVRTWILLGTRNRIRPHVFSALALTVLLMLLSDRIGRIIGIVAGIAIFSYLKELLKSDVVDFRNAHPDAVLEFRPWYTALGWVLLALLFVIMIAVTMEIIVPE
ncbi:MAG TPA: hypothetical protein VMU84_18700 [Thermoanaerobaculia bacterium]|nr:hypothetical protein [Thermoanaerobaculia bacterium]